MLKFLGVIVSVAVLVMTAYVSPSYATSAPVMIAQIQAGGVGGATQEFVALFNNSPYDIDITDWCLKNKTNVAFACFTLDPTRQWHLPAYTYAVIASSSYSTNRMVGLIYDPTNQSSGSITGSSDAISLVDGTGAELDRFSWSTTITGGMTWKRKWANDSPPQLLDTDTAADWLIEAPQFLPDDATYVSSNQETSPPPENPPIQLQPLQITELLPNASGTDTGHEYIELYNPNQQAVLLDGYSLAVGPEFDKVFMLPQGMWIQPTSYLTLSNTDIPFSLLNTSSRVRLLDDLSTFVAETPSYEDPKEDQAWSLIDGIWIYASMTPGAQNVALQSVAETKLDEPSNQNSCASNQFRNPETGRCKLIATTKAPAPCKDNQYRSEETGRCRNISSDTGPAPCKEGQERNPDTNRCRTIVKMPTADYAVLGAQTSSGGKWYMWAAIGALLLLAISYAVWEWRYEIRKGLGRLRQLVPARK